MSRITEFFKSANENGLHFPLARDPVSGQASVTMFFLYLANMMAIGSLIYLHIKGDPFIATCMSVLYAVISTVLYMMRKISKAKFDLKDKSFDLDAGTDEKGKE